MNLEFSQNHEVRERREACGASAQAVEGRQGLRAQLLGELPGAMRAQEGNVGGFALAGVLAGRLSQRSRARFGIEEVVDDLESEPERPGIAIELRALRFAERLAAKSTQEHGCPDQ